MAMFEGNKRVEGSRSNTALVKSGHMSPAEYWILDNLFKDNSMSAAFNLGVLFEYQYGGPGMTEVVIPKGRMVGVTTPIKDFVTKKFVNVMTLPGLTSNANTIGMVPYNICKNWFQEDKFGGNQPSIITLDYVELPYIPSVAASTDYSKTGVLAEEVALSVNLKNPWGCVLGAGVIPGDYLKSTPSGRLCKWTKGVDNPMDVVAQVLAQDFNAEPWGWLKWVMWDEAAKKSDDNYINKSGAGNLPTDYGFPYDPNFAVGTKEMQGYINQFTTDPTGIPGLHDGSGNYIGYGKTDTEYTDISMGIVPADCADDDLIIVQAIDNAGASLGNLVTSSVTVKIDGDLVDAARLTINYKKGVMVIKGLAAEQSDAITATYKAKAYGTPSSLDFKGVVGSLRILLKK